MAECRTDYDILSEIARRHKRRDAGSLLSIYELPSDGARAESLNRRQIFRNVRPQLVGVSPAVRPRHTLVFLSARPGRSL